MNSAISLLTAERDAMTVEITSLKVEKIIFKQSNRRAAKETGELRLKVRVAPES